MKQIYFKFSMLLLLVVVGLGSAKGQETLTVTQNISGTATYETSTRRFIYDGVDGQYIMISITSPQKNANIYKSTLSFSPIFDYVKQLNVSHNSITFTGTKKNSNNITVKPTEMNDYSYSFTPSGGYTYAITEAKVNYTFVLEMNFTTQSLSLAANNKDGYWATFSNNDVTFIPTSDVEGVYTVTVSGTTMTKNLLTTATVKKADDTEITGYFVPAKTGVLINSKNTSATYYTVENKTVVDLDNNYLKPASEAMTGDYIFYKLSYRSANLDGLGFYYGAADGAAFEMTKTNTAYLAVPKGGDVKAFVIEDSATPIKSVTAVAEENAPIFNLAGQRIANPVRGQMYIKNGKKYLAK